MKVFVVTEQNYDQGSVLAVCATREGTLAAVDRMVNIKLNGERKKKQTKVAFVKLHWSTNDFITSGDGFFEVTEHEVEGL